jgi:DNA-binding CsgD family transcriptional regulator
MQAGETDLFRLIGEIYESALDPDGWARTFDSIGDALGGSTVATGLWEAPNTIHRFDGARFDPESVATLFERYCTPDTNPTIDWFARMPVAAPVPLGRFQSRAAFERTGIYHDVYRPNGLRHHMWSVLIRTPSLMAPFGVHRGAASGGFDEAEMEFLTWVLPHLKRAMEIFVRLGRTAAERDGAADILDRCRFGVVLADCTGAPMHMNREAERLLRENDGLTLADGNLAAARPRDDVALCRAIALASRGPGTLPPDEANLSLARPSRRRSLWLQVVPVSAMAPFGGQKRAAVAVFISDPERAVTVSEGMLAGLYGLTPKESQVAARLVAGHDVGDITRQLEISDHTVRTHLKNAFAKTGARGQAELVSTLLRSLPGSALN